MIYHALLIELFFRTGEVTGSLYRVEAVSGSDAVARICAALGCGQGRVYLLSEEEVAVRETGGFKVETL